MPPDDARSPASQETPEGPALPGGTMSPLRHPVFRAVWIASLASSFGGMIQSVGAAWMMTSISGSPDMVALVSASTTLPIMLLSLFSGAAADSFDRRQLMLAAQTFMLVVSLALAAFAWFGLLTPWLLLLFTFLVGCGAALNGPAWQASVGEMVPREDLPSAVAFNAMGFNIARSLGPALGGAIVAAAGAAAAFAINALSYIGLVAVLARWRSPATDHSLPREPLGPAVSAGIRYAAMSPAIGLVVIRAIVFGFGASVASALMPLIARDLVGGGALTFGLLLGAFGAGAVGGALLNARLRRVAASETIVRYACLAFALAAACAGLSRWLVPTMVAMFVAGAAWLSALSTFNVTVQLNSPRWVVARELSLYQMGAFGGMAAGAWTWGVTAAASGLSMALLIAAGTLVLCAALGLPLPLPRVGEANLDPRAWSPPHPALDIEPRSGPVVITIEFRIREADVPEFLQAMADRRRIRRRDGARRWTLLRDLEDPEVWLERFHVPSWIEYIRHNQRMTETDVLVARHARDLHVGPEPPRIRRMIERQAQAWPTPVTAGGVDEPFAG